jgi:hypothetical protein
MSEFTLRTPYWVEWKLPFWARVLVLFGVPIRFDATDRSTVVKVRNSAELTFTRIA